MSSRTLDVHIAPFSLIGITASVLARENGASKQAAARRSEAERRQRKDTLLGQTWAAGLTGAGTPQHKLWMRFKRGLGLLIHGVMAVSSSSLCIYSLLIMIVAAVLH